MPELPSALGCQARMQQPAARLVLCYRPVVVRHSSYGHQGRSAVARLRNDCPACPLRAPTQRCAATALAQGRTSVDAASSIVQLHTDDHEDNMRTRSHMNVVPEGSYRNGQIASHSGAAASSNGALSSTTHMFVSGGESSRAEAVQASSTSEITVQDSLELDLDRERNLSSSSKLEASKGITDSDFEALDRMHSTGSSTERLQDMGSAAQADYVPPRERLKRLRERPDGSLDEKERLRRMRISAANKGKKPWNDGVRHKPETIVRIRTRTREVMNQPGMRAWLKATHKPSTVTDDIRAKISLGVQTARLRKKGIITDGMADEEILQCTLQARAEAKERVKLIRRQKLEASQQDDLRRQEQRAAQAAERALEKQLKEEERKLAVKARADALTAAGAAPATSSARARAKLRRAAAAAEAEPAMLPEQAEQERARQLALQKALQLVMRLEDALSLFSTNVEQIHKTGDTAALERVQQVKLNAEEQLLRAKGQVARLQSGPTPNQSLSKEEAASLSRLTKDQGNHHPELNRIQQALAEDRRSSSFLAAALEDPV